MSRNYYSEIHLHMVWHVKESNPWLTPSVEKIVHDYLRGYVVRTPGAFVHDIGGTETHVHMAVTVPPTLGISELIGKLKGSSAHEANAKLGQKCLEWQSGYGVVSFVTKDLDWVRAYIRDQKEHHANDTIQERLERITFDEAKAEYREPR
jgi:putative transposase